MRRLIFGAALAALAFAAGGAARAAETETPTAALAPAPALGDEPTPGPRPILPASLEWRGPPELPAVKSAWMLGGEKEAGPYVLRVKLAEGGRIAVHAHPDDRVSSVLAGTLYVGFGTVFDETRVQAVPAGAIYLAPADQPHYVWAKDGDVEYQESGFGPSATHFDLH